MNTEALKINLIQQILDVGDSSVLEKIIEILNKQKIAGYDTKGNSVYSENLKKELELINYQIDNGTAVLHNHEDVKKMIANANNLVR